MKKDDTLIIKIEDLSSEGLGVGHSEDGIAFFVKDTVIGDLAEVKVMKMKKNYGFARLMKILEPSPDRIDPPCPVARQCGGCQIQAMSYEAQLRFKENKVRNNLQRIGKFENPPMEPIVGMQEPFRYRNKAQFPVGKDREGKLSAGFYAPSWTAKFTVPPFRAWTAPVFWKISVRKGSTNTASAFSTAIPAMPYPPITPLPPPRSGIPG